MTYSTCFLLIRPHSRPIERSNVQSTCLHVLPFLPYVSNLLLFVASLREIQRCSRWLCQTWDNLGEPDLSVFTFHLSKIGFILFIYGSFGSR